MKNLILILLTALTLTCCDKDDNKNKTPLEQLPPATQTGANTAGCLIDGQAFLPKGYMPSGNLVCNYIDGKDFNISIAQNNNGEIYSMNVISYNQKIITGETYQLKEYGANSQFGEYNIYQDIGDLRYRTTSTVTGELKITNHNFDKVYFQERFGLMQLI